MLGTLRKKLFSLFGPLCSLGSHFLRLRIFGYCLWCWAVLHVWGVLFCAEDEVLLQKHGKTEASFGGSALNVRTVAASISFFRGFVTAAKISARAIRIGF